MPYGISKKLGGDSPSNDARMEKQVSAIMRSGKSKGSAIAIAKAQGEKKAGIYKTPAHHAAKATKGKR